VLPRHNSIDLRFWCRYEGSHRRRCQNRTGLRRGSDLAGQDLASAVPLASIAAEIIRM